jgi:hypothetical protein
MKRRYQIKKQRAVNEFCQLATNANPSAARSLDGGLEETLIVHKLRVPL